MTFQAVAPRLTTSVRSRIAWFAVVAAIAVLAIVLRLYGIARPADYDEGVYWQSLRSMSAGYALYRDIYYSQPPLFLGLTYPIYAALGQSLIAARIAMVLASLIGLCGIYALGNMLAGRTGALVGIALLSINAPYLSQSQTLHAEIPAAAFAIVSVALSLRQGRVSAAWAGFFLAIALLCKLLVVAAIVPFFVLVAMRRRTLPEAAWFVATFAVCVVFAAVFFVRDMGAVLHQVVAFHTAAASAYRAELLQHIRFIGGSLKTPLLASGVLGAYIGIKRRDASALALGGWFLFTVLTLFAVTPLWDHHKLVLFPPLIALSLLALPLSSEFRGLHVLRNAAIVMMALEVVYCAFHLRAYFRENAAMEQLTTAQSRRAIADLSGTVLARDFVITDLPGTAAQANRSTPPWLVDVSEVRIRSGELRSETLIAQADALNVRAVLFGSDRLTLPQLVLFQRWVKRRFRLAARYGPSKELWLR